MNSIIAPMLAALGAVPSPPIDAAEVGRVAFVRFTEAAGRSPVDPVLDGLRRSLLDEHGVVLVERVECSAPDLDALSCLSGAGPSFGAILQIGAGLGREASVIASVDCRDQDRFERMVGGPFERDADAVRWGEGPLAEALIDRVRSCSALPARVFSAAVLPAGTLVWLEGRRLATLDAPRALDITSLNAGSRRLSFDSPGHHVPATSVEARPGDRVRAQLTVEPVVKRPRWLFLSLAGASIGAGVAMFIARNELRSGDCVSFGSCDVDPARDERLADEMDLGVPATMLVAGGAGLAAGELALPRKEPWWLVTLIGVASAGLSALPWLL